MAKNKKRKNKANKGRQVNTAKGKVSGIAAGVSKAVGKDTGKASAPVTAPVVTTVKKDKKSGIIQFVSKEISRVNKSLLRQAYKINPDGMDKAGRTEKETILKAKGIVDTADKEELIVMEALAQREEKQGETEKTLTHVGTLITGDAEFKEKYVPAETVTVLQKKRPSIYRLTIRTMNHIQLPSGIWVTRPQDLYVPCYGRDVYNKLMKRIKRVISDPELRKQWQNTVKSDIDRATGGKIVQRDIKHKGKIVYTYAIHDKLGELTTLKDFQ